MLLCLCVGGGATWGMVGCTCSASLGGWGAEGWDEGYSHVWVAFGVCGLERWGRDGGWLRVIYALRGVRRDQGPGVAAEQD